MRWQLGATKRDAMRGATAGAHAVAARGAAQAIFAAGGRNVLPAAVQEMVRGTVEHETSKLLVAGGKRWIESAGGQALAMVTGTTGRSVAAQTVRGAGRQLARGMSTAAGAGALIDGGWALIGAARRVHSGTMTRRQAAGHVAVEAGTGAIATVAGAAAGALLVALTGGIAAPAVFVVGAGASLGAKMGLDAWVRGRRSLATE
jgi:hypothetical protein